MTPDLTELFVQLRDVLLTAQVRATRSGPTGGYGQERVCLSGDVTLARVQGLVLQLDQVLSRTCEAYGRVNDFAFELERNLEGQRLEDPDAMSPEARDARLRLVAHLKLVASAMHAIEWVDSCDYGPDDEIPAIRAVLGREARGCGGCGGRGVVETRGPAGPGNWEPPWVESPCETCSGSGVAP